jgi:hypothetical protein
MADRQTAWVTSAKPTIPNNLWLDDDQKLQGRAPALIEAERHIANKISRGGFRGGVFRSMLISDMLRKFALGGCLSAPLFFPVALSAQENNAKQQTDIQQSPTAQQTPAPEPTPSVGIDRPKPVETDWKKVECTEPKGHDEADLCEQRRMSQAAEKTVTLNAVQIALGVAGAVLVLFSLHYTRVATRAAITAAKAAEDSVLISRKVGEAQVRAYLSCEGATYTVSDKWLACEARFRNHGQSPAIWTEITAGVVTRSVAALPDGTLGLVFIRSERTTGAGPAIAAGQVGTIFFIFSHEHMGGGAHKSIWSDHNTFDVRGWVNWRDVFGEIQSQEFFLDEKRNASGALISEGERKGELTSYNKGSEHPGRQDI